ncbi:MAG: hypothetical protein Ct9H300mP23_01740 [Nitrospinota bacterium]|nr:MAG: hypothetical protein Ct9H300mP23_01740 [Nitrospinota bacterium]
MFLEIESNPNVERSFDMVYRDISPTRELYCIKYNINGEEQPVQITGWNAETTPLALLMPAKLKNREMGLPYFFLGGTGGVRMKLLEDEGHWDTQSNQQWGDTT